MCKHDATKGQSVFVDLNTIKREIFILRINSCFNLLSNIPSSLQLAHLLVDSESHTEERVSSPVLSLFPEDTQRTPSEVYYLEITTLCRFEVNYYSLAQVSEETVATLRIFLLESTQNRSMQCLLRQV